MNHDQRVFKKKMYIWFWHFSPGKNKWNEAVLKRCSEEERQWWALKWCVSERQGLLGSWEQVAAWPRPPLTSPLTESQSQMPESNNFILKLLSSWKLHSAVFQFSSLWAARLREQKSQETLRMWFAPGDSSQCLRIHEKFLSWKLFFKPPEIVASSPATVLQSPF